MKGRLFFRACLVTRDVTVPFRTAAPDSSTYVLAQAARAHITLHITLHDMKSHSQPRRAAARTPTGSARRSRLRPEWIRDGAARERIRRPNHSGCNCHRAERCARELARPRPPSAPSNMYRFNECHQCALDDDKTSTAERLHDVTVRYITLYCVTLRYITLPRPPSARRSRAAAPST